MKYSIFIGCQIPARVPQYERAVRAVFNKLNVDLIDNRRFNCCGYPMRNRDPLAFLLSSVRNLALAERSGDKMMVLCQCCFGSLKKAANIMQEKGALQDKVNEILKKERLSYTGRVEVYHLLSVLYHDVGIKRLKEEIERPFNGDLKIAAHYGCHALRPSKVTMFDDPVEPRIFDEMVEITGARSPDWTQKLECCGAPAMGINNDLSISLMKKKLESAKDAGADYICTACPYCQMQFDITQQMVVSGKVGQDRLASILYPQLLGLSMGIDDEKLGIHMNRIDIGTVRSYLKKEV
ncbi:MAG: CoB--CoM heterodisulfide reductase iron-sulfur subunit B family protein [Deltaproteobacteria bacterium]|nr:CoB--CoM heterodisulfide reductase iron-sulfur subunit B family protein [Deltaproteobacteria bacterium]